jgi:formyl-CoA transferase
MDIVLAGYSGLLNVTADGPLAPPDPIIDYTAGLLLAWGISTALYTRERTGRGQRLDVALLQAAMVLQNNHINQVDIIDSWRAEFVDYLKTAFAEGATWADILAKRDELQPHVPARVYYGFLRTADGMMSVAALARPLRLKLMAVLGFEDRWTVEPGWEPEDARAYTAALRETVERILQTGSTAHWCEKLSAVGVPCGPLRLPEQLLDDEQALANDFLVRLEHETLGGITVVAPPVHFSSTPLTVTTASPRLGQHTREVLSTVRDESVLDAMEARGALNMG